MPESEYDVEDSAPGEAPDSSGDTGAQRIGRASRGPSTPKVHAPARSLGECPRWMHHRKGEYCKACGKVGK